MSCLQELCDALCPAPRAASEDLVCCSSLPLLGHLVGRAHCGENLHCLEESIIWNNYMDNDDRV